MKVQELKSLLAAYGHYPEIFKSGDKVYLDLTDNIFIESILEILGHCGCKYYRENPRFLPDVFTVEWDTRQ